MSSAHHGRACPGHPDPVERSAFPIGITGTRPVMTWRGLSLQAAGSDKRLPRGLPRGRRVG
ncbi:hypothetical protein J4G37_06665 [Microvirga sp. 3-52]|nr:hypothetical protein [Microvirga sp. 3-52]